MGPLELASVRLPGRATAGHGPADLTVGGLSMAWVVKKLRAPPGGASGNGTNRTRSWRFGSSLDTMSSSPGVALLLLVLVIPSSGKWCYQRKERGDPGRVAFAHPGLVALGWSS